MNHNWKFAAAAATALMMLAGCAPMTEVRPATAEPCRADCRLAIVLPEDDAAEPEIDIETLHIAGGSDVEIRLDGDPHGRDRTILLFHRAGTPFVDQHGRPVFTVRLRDEVNSLTVRSYDDGACRPPGGCKYDIINIGNPNRPARDPYMIIHP